LQKIAATYLFDGYQMHNANKVLVLTQNGIVENLIAIEDAGDDVLHIDGLVTPGLINAHCHLELSHLHTKIPQHTGLVGFISNILQQRFLFTQEQVQLASTQALQAMQQDGIIAVGDICNTADTVAIKKQSPVFFRNFLEVSGFVPEAATKRWQDINAVAARLLAASLDYTFVPHAPYSVSKNLFELINQASGNKTISIHNQETKEEDLFFLEGTGDFLQLYDSLNIDLKAFYTPSQQTSLQTIWPYLNNATGKILVHNTFTNNADIAFISKQQNIYACACPNANLYIENSLPNINEWVANDLNLVIGTDSLASNTTLSIQAEVQTLQKNFTTIPITTWLKAATINGAAALGIADWAGSFTKGKQPGWVQWKNNIALL
jgi:aminodeoxyfutalosine deaminase